ncbi:hypothetical protein HELRODRAFT_175489 [Helobdella robusta]|uniref:Glycosyltransferase family 92 protein n=1 Tax=Helobdella robusta TaxID=6412 RepID=T1F9B5_HELRO|nr:hypothetical protein HELRODRAFT_175489 [Helobdella robusta]ESO00532.1 hypothetical protein HELRODRAFT_175489 [Helobdella robusta]
MRNISYKKFIYIAVLNGCLLYLIQQWPMKSLMDKKKPLLTSIKRSVVKRLIEMSVLQCPHTLPPQPQDLDVVQGTWQVEHHGREKVYLYSAFYDDRPLAGILPTIRVLAMATNAKQMNAYCHVWFDEYPNRALVVEGDVRETGMNTFGYDGVGTLYEYTVSCQLPFKYLHITGDRVIASEMYNSSCQEFFNSNDGEVKIKNMHVQQGKTLLVCNKLNINEEVEKLIPMYVSLSRDVTCKLPTERFPVKAHNSMNNNFHLQQQPQPQQQHKTLNHRSNENSNNNNNNHDSKNATDLFYHTTFLPIFYEFHEKPLVEFSICVANGHDRYDPYQLLEWFEYYKMMGVKEFNLYNTSYSGVESLFKFYEKEGSLIMSQIPHPFGIQYRDTKKQNKIRNLRSVSLNDCMMRNMYRAKYLVVIDHDEFIVPRDNITNFHDLLVSAERTASKKDKPVMSYGFLNTYYFLSFNPEKYKSNKFRTLRFLHRTKPLPPYTGSKSILSPLYCYNLMNHYCYTRLPFYNGTLSIFVSEAVALSHHYRFCGKFLLLETCTQLHTSKIKDDSMLKFEDSIVENVHKVARLLSLVAS